MSDFDLAPIQAALERVLSRATRVESGCLIAHTGPSRYANISSLPHKFAMGAHRAVVLCRGEEIPAGMVVCHSCDVRGCVESQHLSVGTQSRNVRESYERDRHPENSWPVGSGRPQALMTEELVAQMRRSARAGASLQDVVAEFGFSYSSTRMAIRGESWAHIVTEPPVPGRTNQLPNPRAFRLARRDECLLAAQLQDAGHSLSEIAEQLGVSRGTAWKLAKVAKSSLLEPAA